ncbi:MAG: hypothetical protein KatS3mg008_2129 [Acidimicrobiales bacterium]|nr:MAG: hypothetical protein KatS3mg008_2129 [Acidimicrobiales bacterium]
MEQVSADYDLFVNVSYTSAARNRARAGIYVVHFPTPLVGGLRGWRRVLASLSDRYVTGGARVEAGVRPARRGTDREVLDSVDDR